MIDLGLRYSELVRLPTLKDRYNYCRLGGEVGERTFGSLREWNQAFYASYLWKKTRRDVIIRDDGCELAVPGLTICDKRGLVFVHHLNPVTIDDIINNDPWVTDPENLICCGYNVHSAIHYGDESLLPLELPARMPGDTKLW